MIGFINVLLSYILRHIDDPFKSFHISFDIFYNSPGELTIKSPELEKLSIHMIFIQKLVNK